MDGSLPGMQPRRRWGAALFEHQHCVSAERRSVHGETRIEPKALIDKAKAWNGSAAQKAINEIHIKSTKSRTFLVDGLP
jgi:hypothetical protein